MQLQLSLNINHIECKEQLSIGLYVIDENLRIFDNTIISSHEKGMLYKLYMKLPELIQIIVNYWER